MGPFVKEKPKGLVVKTGRFSIYKGDKGAPL